MFIRLKKKLHDRKNMRLLTYRVNNFKIKENSCLILLIILIIIGTFLRFYHLGYNSLWFDEAFTLFTANHTLAGIWEIVTNNSNELASFLLLGEFNPPLFYLIEHFMLMFGQNEFVLRFIPALLGVLTIPVFYGIGKEFRDETTGIVMAALLTFSPFHIYYSQEARAYSSVLFLFSIAFFFFLLSLRINSVKSWILFGFFSGLTAWTHFYTLIPLALLFVYVIYWGISRDRSEMTRPPVYTISLITFLLLYLPLIPLTIQLFLKRTSVPPTWGTKGIMVAGQIFSVFSDSNRYMIIPFFILFMIGTFFLWKVDKEKTLLITGLLGIPIIVSIVLSERMPMNAYYLIYLLPFYFLGISLSFKPLAGLYKQKDITAIIIVIFFIMQAPVLTSEYNTYFTTYSKSDWRGIADTIEENSASGDYIIAVPFITRLPLDVYYHNTSDLTYEFGIRNESEIEQILLSLNHKQAFFVVTGDIYFTDHSGKTRLWLQNNTQRIGTTTGIELYKLTD